MTKRILLYGATGYSGRLIAAAARREVERLSLPVELEVVLGGRDRIALRELSGGFDLDYVAFALDDRARVESTLAGFDVVINAAGPFAHTGVRLAKVAIANGCHYVDINGEVDVYKALDDLGRLAEGRGVTMVSGAGFTATVSDMMLHWALKLLEDSGLSVRSLGVVRIAISQSLHFSRGSLLTMLRSVREEVTLVRNRRFVHVPVGRLERSFDFGRTPTDAPGTSGLRIASAINMLDTLTASHTLRGHGVVAGSIESYADMPRPVRYLYQLGALSTMLFQLPLVGSLNGFQISQLPEGPDEEERQQSRETVLLQIESPYRELWVDWRMETPNSYDFTARSALAVAGRVAAGIGPPLSGWCTPSRVLALPVAVDSFFTKQPAILTMFPFVNCELEGRPVMAAVSEPSQVGHG